LRENLNLILFVDDMAFIHPLIAEDSENDLQADITGISGCINSLTLKLNAQKCKYQVIHLTTRPSDTRLSLNIAGVELERAETYRYLGVEVDDRLTFSTQTQKVAAKAKQGIGALSRALRKWAPTNVLRTAITAITIPALFYGIETWYPANATSQQQLERVLRFAARLLTNDFRRDVSHKELMTTAQLLPVGRQVKLRQLTLIKKYMDGTRFIPLFVFPLESESINVERRSSARLKEKQGKHSLTLKVFTSQRNDREDKLAAARARLLWNELDEVVARAPLKTFLAHIRGESDQTDVVTMGNL